MVAEKKTICIFAHLLHRLRQITELQTKHHSRPICTVTLPIEVAIITEIEIEITARAAVTVRESKITLTCSKREKTLKARVLKALLRKT